ncbi:MAG: cytochrome c3 family protein [Chloroflexota bacterium]|nr:cytochrome c3 family protein [Chloroflexota bacterium]
MSQAFESGCDDERGKSPIGWYSGKTIILVAVVLLAVLALTQVVVADGGPHDNLLPQADSCAGCHRAHSAESGSVLQANSGNALCLTCHDGAGSTKTASTHANSNLESPLLHFSRVEELFSLDCVTCHNPHAPQDNNSLIRDTVNESDVVFTARTGLNSFDEDGDDTSDSDDICVTCHINSLNNQGYPMAIHDGGNHAPSPAYSGDLRDVDCIICHPHDPDGDSSSEDGFMTCAYGGFGCHGLFPNGSVAPNRNGAHEAHYNAVYGPHLTNCDDCHISVTVNDGHNDGTIMFAGNQTLATTTVCDPCHSQGGVYDGVAEAKSEWLLGTRVSCKGCHDAGTSIILGVAAPNVVGDGTTYGYYVSGHGMRDSVECSDCHDEDTVHLDGNSRTYVAGSTSYQSSYRLDYSMTIPLSVGDLFGEDKFELCFQCHYYDAIFDNFSPYQTNFRDENDATNSHRQHLIAGAAKWDSDWDMTIDSRISCTACHNVHGSPVPRGIRHGELISTPGTTDKVPALDFRWYESNGSTITTVLSESRYGDMPPLGGMGMGSIADSKVCNGCHGGMGEITYYRVPILGLTDLEPPEMSNQSPVDTGIDVLVDGNLTFTLSDSEMGVDWTTFQIQLSGNGGYAQSYTDDDTGIVTKTGTAASYDVTVNPGVDFRYGETITVTVDVDDLAPVPNSMVPPAWSFTTEEDTTAPDISDLDPLNGAFDVPLDGNLTFTLSDGESGVDWDTFYIEFNAPGYNQSYNESSSEVEKTGNPASYDVTVNPSVDFPNGETVAVTVTVDDRAVTPNNLTYDSWSFSTVNNAPDTPSNTLPSNGATGVSVTPTLESSAFSDPDSGDTHEGSQWQITVDQGNYTSSVYDSGFTIDLTSHNVAISLGNSTTYYWHVRHQDDHEKWSAYSTETSFTTSP